MKNLILIILTLISFNLMGQSMRVSNHELPAFLIDANNDTVGVVFSIDDAHKIDNDLTLFKYAQELNIALDTSLYDCMVLLDEQNVRHDIMRSKVVNLVIEGKSKDRIIAVLKKDSELSGEQITKLLKLVQNKDLMLKEKEGEVKTLKFHRTVLGILLTAVLVLGSVR